MDPDQLTRLGRLLREPGERKEDLERLLETFAERCGPMYDFSVGADGGEAYKSLTRTLVREIVLRPEESAWMSPRRRLFVAQVLRVLLRDADSVEVWLEEAPEAVDALSAELAANAAGHYDEAATAASVDLLVEQVNIVKRLAGAAQPRAVAAELHAPLILLLGTRDGTLLHCVLNALLNLVDGAPLAVVAAVAELEALPPLLRIVGEYPVELKLLATQLLTMLCDDGGARARLRAPASVSAFVSVLHHTDDLQLIFALLELLTRLAEHPDAARAVTQLGGLPLLVALLHAKQRWAAEHEPLLLVLCRLLAALALDDETNYGLRLANGVYGLGQVLLDDVWRAPDSEVWAHVFLVLRLLFSLERNRKLFRRLFNPELYAAFIDVGHYQTDDLAAYRPLCGLRRQLSPADVARMRSAFALLDANAELQGGREIRGYLVEELLGKGAYGTVFQVRKGDARFAMKEIPLQADDDDAPREAEIIQQLRHPNIIRFEEHFVNDGKLYIVMELVEGTSLEQHVSSVREKGHWMPEERIWRVFVQMCQALRLMHVDQGVIHRDLSPANVLLDPSGLRVKITDFGLAASAQAKGDGVVGTVRYSSPEVVQSLPYGPKADVWSLGCILFQMATLRPPFDGANPLAVAQQVVEGEVAPVNGAGEGEGQPEYSPLLCRAVRRMLTVDPAERPDIEEVLALIAPVLARELDRLAAVTLDQRARLEEEAQAGERRRLRVAHMGGGGGLTVSADRVRPITDQCEVLLKQLHKLVYISQQPPALERDWRRAVVDAYKRHLFSPDRQLSSWGLKNELKQLVEGSHELSEFAGTVMRDGELVYGRVAYAELHGVIEALYRSSVSR